MTSKACFREGLDSGTPCRPAGGSVVALPMSTLYPPAARRQGHGAKKDDPSILSANTTNSDIGIVLVQFGTLSTTQVFVTAGTLTLSDGTLIAY